MPARCTRRQRASALGAILLTLSATTPALAWTEKTHEELARQSIQYMLRSSNERVRFAGVAIVSAGEGQRSTPAGKREWTLSDEARLVDKYRDVAMRVEGAFLEDVPSGVGETRGVEWNGDDIILAYSFTGANFTAYDHFLLYGEDTGGMSIEKYTTRADGTRVPHLPGNPTIPVPEYVFMDAHDNQPGFTLAFDSSLEGDYRGEFIRLIGSRELRRKCQEVIHGTIRGSNDFEWWNPVSWVGEVEQKLRGVVADLATPWLTTLCPYAVGSWEFSPALKDTLAVNHSTIDRWDVEERFMYDIRFHPADNLASRGDINFTDRARVVADEAPDYDCRPPRPGDAADPRPDCTDLPEHEPAFRAFVGGNLRALGRTLHAMSDISVPGHVSGMLLAPEHLAVEGAAAQDTADLGSAGEHRTATGGVEPDYESRNGVEYDIHWYIDVPDVEERIAAVVNDSIFMGRPMEHIAEQAAYETRLLRNQLADRGEFDTEEHGTIRPDVRSKFLTRAVANNVVALTHSIHRFYDAHSTRSMRERVRDITWTNSDRDVVFGQPASDRSKASPRPYLPKYEVPNGDAMYSLNVDAHYQEYQEYGGCYVTSHDWCDDENDGRVIVGGRRPCQGVERHRAGPPFVPPSHVGARVVLSADNRGDAGEQIHITGTHSSGNLDESYFRAPLTESAGEAVDLPRVSLDQGVAVWCNGPDAWRETGPNASVCAVAEIQPLGAYECNRAERVRRGLLFESTDVADTYDPTVGGSSSGGSSSPVVVATGDLVTDLAADLKTSEVGLSSALESADRANVTLVQPSPFGRATLVWNDADKGLANEATVSATGRIVVRRTPARP